MFGELNQVVSYESCLVCNISSRPIELEGYSIRSNANSEGWTFPSMIVPVGGNVKIYSGRGRNQYDPAEQLEIFLGSDSPVWNDCNDVATIRDRYGQLVDMREHKPQKCE